MRADERRLLNSSPSVQMDRNNCRSPRVQVWCCHVFNLAANIQKDFENDAFQAEKDMIDSFFLG